MGLFLRNAMGMLLHARTRYRWWARAYGRRWLYQVSKGRKYPIGGVLLNLLHIAFYVFLGFVTFVQIYIFHFGFNGFETGYLAFLLFLLFYALLFSSGVPAEISRRYAPHILPLRNVLACVWFLWFLHFAWFYFFIEGSEPVKKPVSAVYSVAVDPHLADGSETTAKPGLGEKRDDSGKVAGVAAEVKARVERTVDGGIRIIIPPGARLDVEGLGDLPSAGAGESGLSTQD